MVAEGHYEDRQQTKYGLIVNQTLNTLIIWLNNISNNVLHAAPDKNVSCIGDAMGRLQINADTPRPEKNCLGSESNFKPPGLEAHVPTPDHGGCQFRTVYLRFISK